MEPEGALAGQLAADLEDAIRSGNIERVRAIEIGIDQADGKPKQSIEHESTPVTIQLVGFSLGNGPEPEPPPPTEVSP